jgi:hypothetical protein
MLMWKEGGGTKKAQLQSGISRHSLSTEVIANFLI